MTRNLHVVVLMGGWSSEREVSLTSGQRRRRGACASAAGHNVTELDMDRDVARVLAGTEARRRVQRAARHAGRGRHGPGHARPDADSLHAQRARNVGHRHRQGADQDGAGAARHPHARGQDRREREPLRRRPDGAALCAEAGQRGLVGRRRDRHRRRQLRQSDRPRRRGAVACISTACSPSRSSRAAS